MSVGYNNVQVRIINDDNLESRINETLSSIKGTIINVQLINYPGTLSGNGTAMITYIPEATTRMTLKESK